MRVTEGRMMELAEVGVGKARESAVEAGDQLTSGRRVERPSDDPTAWADGMRSDARLRSSEARGRALSRAEQMLDASDEAFSRIGTGLSRARELAIQMANGTLSPADRVFAAAEIAAIRTDSLSAANSRSIDGEYIFGGDQSGAPPFTSTGLFIGTTAQRTVEVSETGDQIITISGTELTSASGVDVLAELENFRAALVANNVPAITAAIGTLSSAIDQVARARSQVGSYLSAVQNVDEQRRQLEVRLAAIKSNALDADPVKAASELSQARSNLEASQAFAQQIIQMTRKL